MIGNGLDTLPKSKDFKEMPYPWYHSVTEYSLELAKLFRLLKNEKTLLLSNEDMFTKISLILTRVQKETLGDVDIQVSDVIDTFRIIKEKSTNGSIQTNEDGSFDTLSNTAAKEYLKDIKSQNMIDTWTLYKMISNLYDCKEKTSLSNMLETVKKANVLMILPDNFRDPKLPDLELARILFSEDSYLLQMLEFHDSVQTDEVVDENVPFLSNLTSTSWKNKYDLANENDISGKEQKRDDNYHLQLFQGYLRLLTNTRDELSLAKVLCGTGGLVKHDAFDVIKKESLETRMPMYQVKFLSDQFVYISNFPIKFFIPI